MECSLETSADILDEFDLQTFLQIKELFSNADIPAGESRTIDFNQLLNEVPEDEFDIDEVKEEFKNLITEIASDVRLALEQASGAGKEFANRCNLESILTYDRAGTCPSCGRVISLNQAFQTTAHC